MKTIRRAPRQLTSNHKPPVDTAFVEVRPARLVLNDLLTANTRSVLTRQRKFGGTLAARAVG